MAKVEFTKENMPTSSEEFRRLLDEAIENSSPIDDLLELAADMAVFEKKYGMPSAEFDRKFHSGQLGDDIDYFEWSAIYRMFVDTKRSIELALMRASVQVTAEGEVTRPVEQVEAVPA